MGTLFCYDWDTDDAGNKSCPVIGLEVNGITLGQPVEGDALDDFAKFDDSVLPNGTITRDGVITLDEEVI